MSEIDDRRLEEIARALPDAPPSAARVAELRGTLLSAASQTPQRTRDARWPLYATAAAALLAAGGAVMWSSGPKAPRSRIAAVNAAGATFEHRVVEDGALERIRLSEGTIRVGVEAPLEGRRFVVRTLDAQVGFEGAVVEVVASQGRLTRVRAIAGRVQVRTDEARAPILLGPRETWSRDAVAKPGPARRRPAPVAARPAPSPRPRPEAPRPEPAAQPARTAKPLSPKPRPVAPSAPRPAPPEPAEDPAELGFREGWSQLRAGNFARAADAFAQADREGSPVAPEARYWRAVALMRAGRRAPAESALSSFVESHPSSPRAAEAHLLLGRLLVDRGATQAARPHLERAARADEPQVARRARELIRSSAPDTQP